MRLTYQYTAIGVWNSEFLVQLHWRSRLILRRCCKSWPTSPWSRTPTCTWLSRSGLTASKPSTLSRSIHPCLFLLFCEPTALFFSGVPWSSVQCTKGNYSEFVKSINLQFHSCLYFYLCLSHVNATTVHAGFVLLQTLLMVHLFFCFRTAACTKAGGTGKKQKQ